MKRAVCGLLLGLWLGTAQAETRLGKVAEDFSLQDQAGAKVRLSELRGKVVVIDFWASWCDPCLRELPELEKLQQQWAAKGVVFLAINLDQERSAATAAARRLGLRGVRVLLDPQGKVAERWEPPKMPTSYVLGPDGVVRLVNEGYEGPTDIERLRAALRGLIK